MTWCYAQSDREQTKARFARRDASAKNSVVELSRISSRSLGCELYSSRTGCSDARMDAQGTATPAMLRERRSWMPAAAEGPRIRPGKPGTPTTGKCDLPAGSDSSRVMPTRSERTEVRESRTEPTPGDSVIGGTRNEPDSLPTPPRWSHTSHRHERRTAGSGHFVR
jgi:hypothetical protein